MAFAFSGAFRISTWTVLALSLTAHGLSIHPGRRSSTVGLRLKRVSGTALGGRWQIFLDNLAVWSPLTIECLIFDPDLLEIRRDSRRRSLRSPPAPKTGHSGTLSTVHANSALQGISRFTTCVLQSGIELSYMAVKTNIAESLNIVVHIERRPGHRFIAQVLNLRGLAIDGDAYEFESVYQYPSSTGR